MSKYTEEFKREMVKKLLPPSSILASALSREIGVGKSTLYKWRKQYVEGSVTGSSSASPSEKWSGACYAHTIKPKAYQYGCVVIPLYETKRFGCIAW